MLLVGLSAEARAKTVIVVPHPDDETLGLAGAIREKVLLGEEVWVVMATHGEASGVRGLLNGSTTCGLCGRIHNPTDEGYLPADLSAGVLTATGFGDARLREFHASLEVLGVPESRHIVHDLGDGNVTSAEAAMLFNILVGQFGSDADYLTVQGACDTTHKDHIALADALQNNTQIANSHKYFYAVYEYANTSHSTMPVLKDIQPYMAKKQEALNCYKLYQPQSGRYAVGIHSVSNLIRNAGLSPYEFPRTLTSRVSDWQLF